MIDKKTTRENKSLIHPVAAAAMGAVVGAAGGIAAAKYLSDPQNQKIVGEKFSQIREEASRRWKDLDSSNEVREKVKDLLDEGKK